MPRSLNQFRKLRSVVVSLRRHWLAISSGIDIHPTANLSLNSHFVTRTRGAICVGPETYITFKTLVMSYDSQACIDRPVCIGRRCFIGGGSFIGPGVIIGDGCIVAAGSVVTTDVPPRCIVGGNPATVIKRDIAVGPYGKLVELTGNSP